jgi:hypothetical protein
MNMALTACVLVVSFGCQKPPTPKAVGDEPAFRKPTATEVFNLRSKCAELGERINSENDFTAVAIPSVTVPLLKQEHASHYNPETNRCYVELHVGANFDVLLLLSKANAKARTMNAAFLDHYDLDFTERHLYDGQTGEELAFVQKGLKGAKATGIIKGRFTESGNWADAANEIDDRMADDRKR